MALLWIDGFDAYGGNVANVTNALLAAGYTMAAPFASNPSPETLNSTATGVGYALDVATWPYGGTITRNFPTTAAVVVGVRVNMQTGAFQEILQFSFNNYLGGGGTQLILVSNGSNGLTLYTADNVNVYSTAPNVLFEGVWQYIEVSYTPGAGVAGAAIVKIDGVVVINEPAAATVSTGLPNSINQLTFAAGENTVWIDDLYICDQTGATFNTFLGDCVVHAIFPVADAGPNQFTQVGGSSGHYTSVDDQTPDGNTSYVYSNTSGQKELYSLATFPADIVEVLAVGVNVLAEKSAAGQGLYQACLSVSSVEVDSNPQSAPAADYIGSQFLATMPPAGGAWTLMAAQSALIGVLIT